VSDARKSQATILCDLAVDAGAVFFHDIDRVGYATIDLGDHSETWPLRTSAFRAWLGRLYYLRAGSAPGAQAVQDALAVLEGHAVFAGREFPVAVRLAELPDGISLDLGDEHWQVVHVTADGWSVLAGHPGARFRRPRGLAALPLPVKGGSIDELRPFLNVGTDDDFRLLVAALLAALRPQGPYPIVILLGEQGSSKSTAARVLRSLSDPSTSPLRTAPRDERDLMVAARNSWVLAFDNLSTVPDWLSDGLCRLSTGGGLSTRQLYSDADEVFLYAQRPVILNSITEVATRGDLIDRAVMVTLPVIGDDERQTEEAFWGEFAEAAPRILGALLDAVSVGLRNLSSTSLDRLPRMADFARWSFACSPGLGWSGEEFLSAYSGARESVHEVALEASELGGPLRLLLDDVGEFEGTASALLKVLAEHADESATRRRGWPSSPRVLSAELTRLAPNLRAVGIEFERARGRRQGRCLRVWLSRGDAGDAGIPTYSSEAA
jgi:hypothetical protein